MSSQTEFPWVKALLFIYTTILSAIGYDAVQKFNTFVLSGREFLLSTTSNFSAVVVVVSSTFLSNLIEFYPLYLAATILLGLPICYHFFRSSQWKRTATRLRQDVDNILQKRKEWETWANQKIIEAQLSSQRCDNLKKHISEAVSPCGQVIFNADDTVSLQHLFCQGYRKLEAKNKEYFEDIRYLNKQLLRARRYAPVYLHTAESTAAMKCAEMEEMEATVELLRLRLGSAERVVKDLRGKIEHKDDAQKIVKCLREEIGKKNGELKTLQQAVEEYKKQALRTKAQIKQFEAEESDFTEQIDGLTSDNVKVQKELAAANESKDILQKQVSELQKEAAAFKKEILDLQKALKDTVSTTNHVPVNDQSATTIADLKAQLSRQKQEESERRQADKERWQNSLLEFKAQAQKEIDTLRNEKTASQTSLQEAQAQHEKEIGAARQEIEALKGRTVPIANADVRGHEEYQKLLVEGQKIMEERDELRGQVSILEAREQGRPSDEDIENAKGRYAELEKLYSDALGKIAEQEKSIESLSEEVPTVDADLVQENQNLRGEVEGLKKELAEKKKKLFEVRGGTDIPVVDWKAIVTSKEDSIEALQYRLKKQESKISEQEQKIEEGAVLAAGKEFVNTELRAKLKRADQEIVNLTTVGKQQMRDIDKLQNERTAYRGGMMGASNIMSSIVPGQTLEEIEKLLKESHLAADQKNTIDRIKVLMAMAQDSMWSWGVMQDNGCIMQTDGPLQVWQAVQFVCLQYRALLDQERARTEVAEEVMEQGEQPLQQ